MIGQMAMTDPTDTSGRHLLSVRAVVHFRRQGGIPAMRSPISGGSPTAISSNIGM